MADAVPRALLEGREPDLPPPREEAARRRNLLSRLLGRG
jgi:hypothetical protein